MLRAVKMNWVWPSKSTNEVTLANKTLNPPNAKIINPITQEEVCRLNRENSNANNRVMLFASNHVHKECFQIIAFFLHVHKFYFLFNQFI